MLGIVVIVVVVVVIVIIIVAVIPNIPPAGPTTSQFPSCVCRNLCTHTHTHTCVCVRHIYTPEPMVLRFYGPVKSRVWLHASAFDVVPPPSSPPSWATPRSLPSASLCSATTSIARTYTYTRTRLIFQPTIMRQMTPIGGGGDGADLVITNMLKITPIFFNPLVVAAGTH